MSEPTPRGMEWLGREMAKRQEQLVLAAFSGTRVACDACDGWGWGCMKDGVMDTGKCNKCNGQGIVPHDPKVTR